MKRYNVRDKIESPTGDMIMFADHEAERKELYETIDSNSKKIIKLMEQNGEMLNALKICLELFYRNKKKYVASNQWEKAGKAREWERNLIGLIKNIEK